MTQHQTLHWFRQDLRLQDNPALFEAVQQGSVLPIFILDDDNAGNYKRGAASRWWLHHSLASLNTSLHNNLHIYAGDPLTIITQLIKRYNITHVHWNRCYEAWRMERDTVIKTTLTEMGITVNSFNGSLLWEPWETYKEDNTPYKVFTPFFRNGCAKALPPRKPLPKPKKINTLHDPHAIPLDKLNLLPTIKWDNIMQKTWNIGEKSAHKKLDVFIQNTLTDYKEQRNYPAKSHTSLLSPHLHFGEISPNHIWHAIKQLPQTEDHDHFCSELAWREFSYGQLYNNPTLPTTNLQSKFDGFPWRDDNEALTRWQNGQTGYPIVDAGMRELWQTGYMHNRVRMIVGSFLVKNLLLHWHHGERWFWDCLVDADLANNSASWQWIAGCGADAAPYFRIFNPITQGEKFDKKGEYTRHYVPELSALPDKYLFCPWKAPKHILESANITLGKNYPPPIIDIPHSRERALAAFRSLSI